jgi:hypothetical protein
MMGTCRSNDFKSKHGILYQMAEDSIYRLSIALRLLQVSATIVEKLQAIFSVSELSYRKIGKDNFNVSIDVNSEAIAKAAGKFVTDARLPNIVDLFVKLSADTDNGICQLPKYALELVAEIKCDVLISYIFLPMEEEANEIR